MMVTQMLLTESQMWKVHQYARGSVLKLLLVLTSITSEAEATLKNVFFSMMFLKEVDQHLGGHLDRNHAERCGRRLLQ